MSEYNYLGLVNDINGRLNEVPLSDTNFLSASGWYSQAKESVNSAIQHISHQESRFPFYYVEQTDTLTEGQIKYEYPTGAESVKMDSFRIVKNSGNNVGAVYLIERDYEEILQESVDIDSNEVKTGVPKWVFRYPSMHFGIYPPANDEYTMKYEWYRLPLPLVNATDTPLIPYQWRHVIINGAMMYAYMFRGDPESSALMKEVFDNDIKHMKKVYENRYVSVRGSMINRRGAVY